MKIGVILSTIFVVLFLTGCNSLKLGNILETTALAGVGYATGGIAPAVAVGTTSVIANELQPEEKVSDIETTEQLIGYVSTELMYYGLAGFIAYLLIREVIIPFFAQRRRLRRLEYDMKHKES